jgi:hypothetical protein
MAHFAEIGLNNKVLRVIVVHDSECLDANGIESEAVGQEFCKKTFGGTWLKTSYSGKIRKRFAGIGYTYDSELDVFIPEKPYKSWVFDNVEHLWVAPISMPSDGKFYTWNEDDLAWEEVFVTQPLPEPINDKFVIPTVKSTVVEEVAPVQTTQVEVLSSSQLSSLSTAQVSSLMNSDIPSN